MPTSGHALRSKQKKETRRDSHRSKPKSSVPILDDVFLQPWFLPKEIAFTIRRLLPPGYRERMYSYFLDYGCIRCNGREVLYGTNGFCERCKVMIQRRIVWSVKRRSKNLPSQPAKDEVYKDTIRMQQARELLGDIAPKKLKHLASHRMRKSQFVNPDRLSYAPSMKR